MGALHDLLVSLPPRWEDEVGERLRRLRAGDGEPAPRIWQLWLEAERCKRTGKFNLARNTLTAADELAGESGWTPEAAPVWRAESLALRGTLLHDDGEPGQAFAPLRWALHFWIFIGNALQSGGDSDFGSVAVADAFRMVRSLVGPETPVDVAVGTWLVDRLVPETCSIAARIVDLTAARESYGGARRVVNDLLATFRRWELPGWNVVDVEIGLREGLYGAAEEAQLFDTALGQANDTLTLVSQLTAGPTRSRREAEARTNRANVLCRLQRPHEAVGDYELADRVFVEIGAAIDALTPRVGALRARADAGGEVPAPEVARLLGEVETAAETPEGSTNGRLMGDLEFMRRWYLSQLAESGDAELEEVVGLIESIRGDCPLMRDGRDHDDPVVAQLCRPFTVLGSRLARLPETVLLVYEPRMFGQIRRPCVFLTISVRAGELHWQLVAGGDETESALVTLSDAAAAEHERLATREVPIHSKPPPRLTEAARRAWSLLPDDVRAAILASRTILYLPSSVGDCDTIPLELLLHDGGWLGATHVVARCASFQILEDLVAPNARRLADDERATVVRLAADEHLEVLPDADRDAQTAMRAATVFGLQPEYREISTEDDGLDVFTRGSLVHYVGHGFASELGEFLPLSKDFGISAKALAERAATATPFVFFNACLLGRVRHLGGGRQRGWALTLLESGAPAVVGALYPVPDDACPLVAEAFYRGAWKAPVGEGIRRARIELDEAGVNPLIWSAYVLHGDPNAVISRSVGDAPRSTRELTTRWPARLTRFLATQLPDGRDDVSVDAPAAVTDWIAGRPDPAALARAVDDLLDRDAEGAAACRILLAIERMRASAPEVAGSEFETAYLAASALDDGYAMLFLLGRYAIIDSTRRHVALATASAWLQQLSADEPSLARLLNEARGTVSS